ncbi:hypothetical protein [Nocardia crassostreae]|uniref:hypothetical protein n=1 Tax=Nocardia crassostreae TaxID=53428 RepID=UPI0009FD9808|nr:hypothetical protein [Nocardia crassostreae]
MISNDTWSILIHLPAPVGAPRPPALNLWPGEVATFGRGTDIYPVDVTLDREGISRLAGRIEALDFYWLISNLSTRSNKSYVVHNDEGKGEYFTIRPGERLPVPFRAARVELLAADAEVMEFKVFAMRRSVPAIPVAVEAGRTVDAIRRLDPNTKHSLVLVALCEPRLVHGSAAIPTLPELLRRVRRTTAGRDLGTTAAINYHLEYLVDRLGLRDYDGLEDRRAALINRALWFGLVGEQHLELLTGEAG